MSFYEFNLDSLKDSKSFARSIVRNIVPRGGKEITSTSLSSRGFENSSMTTVDLISAASGKELLKNSYYQNIFHANIIRENLNSLSTTIMEGQLPTSTNQDQASLSLSVLSQSGIGLDGNRGLVDSLTSALKNKYEYGQTSQVGIVNGLPHEDQDYFSTPASLDLSPVALASKMTISQRFHYSERHKLLSSKITISKEDKISLLEGFNLSIDDSKIDLMDGSRVAYISASLTECLLALVSSNYGSSLDVTGSFGISRLSKSTQDYLSRKYDGQKKDFASHIRRKYRQYNIRSFIRKSF